MKNMVMVFLAVLCSCQTPETNYVTVNKSQVFDTEIMELAVKTPYINNAVEASVVVFNSNEYTFVDHGMNGNFDLSVNGSEYITISGYYRFANVTLIDNIFYCTYSDLAGDVYLKISTDGMSWSEEKLILSVEIGTIYNTIWNVALTRGLHGWVLEIECSETDNSMAYVVELKSDKPYFDEVKHRYTAISKSGNPWCAYVAGKGWLMLCGDISGGFWKIVAYVKPIGCYEWVKTAFSVAKTGVHICDPFLYETRDGNVSLLASFDQKSVIKMDYSITMKQLYDDITEVLKEME